ncbi:hypothetical protein PUNSTDRAFT_49595 [Punctularia strigosozonata HHB-11173 SS5]|uniref:uncharacterized protein n=1 Tax=Punctularia strigosozonata (strain HHB-11173) TaxID=741275 RepID=UPI0004417798|nr:uncharacterized protein PUNSTDRAFT_49595 [Punctularia strigosozonata HHB-11173 SS5]EIN12340.1 hypothetical protein PUNSTDRAFT_49595 [Punctularia strigosozonata HHB-11173 SS5]
MVPQLSATRRRRAHPFLLTPTAPIAIPNSHRRIVEQPLSPIRCNSAMDDQLVFAMSPDCTSPALPNRYIRARKDTATSHMSSRAHAFDWNITGTENKPVEYTPARPAQPPLTPAQKLAAEYRASAAAKKPAARPRAFTQLSTNPQLPSPASSVGSADFSPEEMSASPAASPVVPAFGLTCTIDEKHERSTSSERRGNKHRPRPPPTLRWKTTPQLARFIAASGAGAQLSTNAVSGSLVTPPLTAWPSSVLLDSDLMDTTLVEDAPEKDAHDLSDQEPQSSLKRVQSDLQKYLFTMTAFSKADSPERGRRRERTPAR